MPSIAGLPREYRTALATQFKLGTLRPAQEQVLRAVADGAHVLAVLPTGAGKSLCFQLPAALSSGLTLCISPLIALMRDQVLGLRRCGIRWAGAAHGLQTAEETERVYAAVSEGRCRLLYVAPERLRSRRFWTTAAGWTGALTCEVAAVFRPPAPIRWRPEGRRYMRNRSNRSSGIGLFEVSGYSKGPPLRPYMEPFTRRKVQAGFSLIELLMVVGIILIIAALAIPGLVRARSSAGESSAVATLRVLFQAEARYSNLFDNSFSTNLNSLGPPPAGQSISPTSADLVDEVLSARIFGQPSRFIKSGYLFTYTSSGTFPDIRTYTLTADPTARGSTGVRSFYMDNSGVIRFNSNAQATVSDSPLR